MVLAKMRSTAEEYVGKRVEAAVITVPAYFNDAQRQATKDAGAIAGLEVLRIVNEPTAAALAYGLQEHQHESEDDREEDVKNVLVFDLGGGTFDVSLLAISKGVFDVKATAGDTHLGGEDFDSRLVDHVCAEFERRHAGKSSLRQNARALRRLRTACERAKRRLSSRTEAHIEIESLYEGNDLEITITRAKFEDLCSDYFRAVLGPVEQVLKDAKIRKKKHVDDIVLVGGSTRIPKIQEVLSKYFDDKDLNKSINPDEAIAYGAAVQANILSGNASDDLGDLLLLDVTPLSLGVQINDDTVVCLIKRNTRIPSRKQKPFTTVYENQAAVDIRIFEGERPVAADNHYLGEFTLHGIPPMKEGQAKIEVTFEIDANGILNVTAVESSTGKSNKITIKNDAGHLSKEQIAKMVQDAETFKAQDEANVVRLEAKSNLDHYIRVLKSTILDEEDRVKDAITAKINEVTLWLRKNHQDASKQDFEAMKQDVESFAAPLLQQKKKHPPTPKPPPPTVPSGPPPVVEQPDDGVVVKEEEEGDDDDDDLPDLVEEFQAPPGALQLDGGASWIEEID
ncbi:hypothetical protein CTAYLR_008503 [Chrysophaeum taylorii]|uniref:Heat shock protein 70 n=1 Tax=Chrysophaeum taylorii TaxID=2483200 RepID=A0AAD7XJV1_9STRA|nr:hypothetical protein CTAYLR_008503 [Chrysophaeum taylorii]